MPGVVRLVLSLPTGRGQFYCTGHASAVWPFLLIELVSRNET